MNIKCRLVASFMIGLMLSSLWLSSGVVYAAKGISRSQRSLSLQLYNLSGAGKEKAILASQIKSKKTKVGTWTHEQLLHWVGFSRDHVDIINKIYSGALSPDAYYGQLLKRISKNYNRSHVLNSVQFFRSPLGRKVVNLQTKPLKATPRAYMNFLNKLMEKVETRERLELWNRLANALGTTDLVIEQAATLLRLTQPVAREFNAPDSEVLANRLRSELRDQVHSKMILSLMFSFSKLSDRELQKYVKFLESPAGQWFKKVQFEGHMAGYATVNRKALRSMEKIMKVIESGHQSLETTRAVFAPGLRYLFSDKRDPFEPLVTEEGEKEKTAKKAPEPVAAAPAGPSSVEQLAAEIEAIPSIPFEIYQRVKESDPRLYADLEYYGSLFKNKNTLARMKTSELQEEIDQYTSLIERAKKDVGQLVVTPMQAPLNELTLAGVIWDQKETVGLIETPDTKGHSVRVGSFLGPEYGVIQSIDEERIVVLEKFRKFDGQVISVTQYVEFPKSDTEE